jgi:hypothetical protein
MTFEFIETADSFFEGSNAVLTLGGVKIFDGFVFERTRTEDEKQKVICYDRIRYLNNHDTKVYENSSPNEIFTEICTEHELPFVITNGSDYKIAPIVHDNKALYAMIIRALDESFIHTMKYIILRDNAGILELVDVENLMTNILIGDQSLLTGYEYKCSIDAQTYNYIKLVQENKEEKVREAYVAKDSETIYKWGRLQYFEKVDEEMNPAQIRERTEQLLRLYNRKTKTIRVKCFGDFQVREGSGIILAINKLEGEQVPYMQRVFVSKSVHKISNEVHTMELDLEVV